MHKVGLLFGSFDPIHNGHLAIAAAGIAHAGASEVWFVLQAHNLYKQQTGPAELEHRMAMVRLAIKDNPQFKLVVTKTGSMLEGLQKLGSHFADAEFILLMGQDLAESLPSWRDSAKIIKKYHIYSYHRGAHPSDEISSEQIRQAIASGISIAQLMPKAVTKYIKKHHLYTQSP